MLPPRAFAEIPNSALLSTPVIDDLRDGTLCITHLFGSQKAVVRTLNAVAALDAPIWLYEHRTALGDGWYLFPCGALLNFTRPPKRMGHMPTNFFTKPDTLGDLRQTAKRGQLSRIPDRSSYLVALPKPSTRELQVFSQYGMVRFFEETARTFPERKVPSATTSDGRAKIVAAWRRQNG